MLVGKLTIAGSVKNLNYKINFTKQNGEKIAAITDTSNGSSVGCKNLSFS